MPLNRKFNGYILGFLFIAAILVWSAVAQSPKDQNLHLYFLNVGQGDSAYILTPSGQDILIDGGPDGVVLSELSKVMPFYDRQIDFVILSHPHADHLVGLIEVLKNYEVGEIIATDAIHTSPEYFEWLKIIKEKKVAYKLSFEQKELNVGQVNIDFLYPDRSLKDAKIDNLNNTSLVVRLSYGSFSTLFPGDAEEEEQTKLITHNSIRQLADKTAILKVPHHGSKDGLSPAFLAAVSPEVAVISVGRDNKYGHPAEITLQKLEKANVKIYRTDQDGRIEIASDGKKWWRK